MSVQHFQPIEQSEAWERSYDDPVFMQKRREYLNTRDFLRRYQWHYFFTGTSRHNSPSTQFHKHLQEDFYYNLIKRTKGSIGMFYVVATKHNPTRTHAHALIVVKPGKNSKLETINSADTIKSAWGLGYSRAGNVIHIGRVCGYVASHRFPSQAIEYGWGCRGKSTLAIYGNYVGDGLDGWLIDHDTHDTPDHLRKHKIAV